MTTSDGGIDCLYIVTEVFLFVLFFAFTYQMISFKLTHIYCDFSHII